MLLNAANVVTAAERCNAIDQKTGRIPINFLLSRSNDLDDHVKDQLHALAATSSTISILPHNQHSSDAIMTDIPHSLPIDQMEDVSALQHDMARNGADMDEALKDIDRESRCPDRSISRRNQKRHQTLTRKAIRKHTGGKKIGNKERNAMDTSSTRNTVASSECKLSSVASTASHSSNTPRRRWKDWEDELLMKVVAENGPTKWNNLAKYFPGRNGRQVRLRWMNHLQPSLDKRPWRPEEDAVLLEAHQALGNKWALISMRLGGRTDNSVKNRYKSIVRRKAREAKMGKKQD